MREILPKSSESVHKMTLTQDWTTAPVRKFQNWCDIVDSEFPESWPEPCLPTRPGNLRQKSYLLTQ